MTITPADWQELRSARNAALKADPDLMKKAAELSARMRAFQQKLDAAMIQTDPNIAPIVEKIEHGRPAPQMMRIPSPAPGGAPAKGP